MRGERVDGGVERVVALPANDKVLTPVQGNPIVHLLLDALVPLVHVRHALVQ